MSGESAVPKPLAIVLAATVCIATATANGGSVPALTTEVVVTGLASPTFVAFDPADDNRMFVVEKAGRVRLVLGGVIQPTPFLDLSASVTSSTFGGMTGFAFAPDFETSGDIYVIYPTGAGTNGDRVELARYTVSAGDPNVVDPASRLDILSIANGFNPQFHIGGWIGFGPDNMLYIPLGDGTTTGGEATGGQRSQSLTSMWGKTLRIDPSADAFPADATRHYTVPSNNPFVGIGAGVLEEIWSSGLRNPYRASFDRLTGDFWIADVGLGTFEEINVEPVDHLGGRNYGWNCAEGTTCTTNANCNCTTSGLTMPVHVYPRTSNCSITGGVVYRGCAIDGLQGRYFYSDWCSGNVWSIMYDGAIASDEINHTVELNNNGGEPSIARVTSITEDSFGELYICSEQGRVYKVLPATGIVDKNMNGIPDLCEPSNAADFNSDGTVDSSDLATLLAGWGACAGSCVADLNNDNTVDSADLAILLAAWG